MPKILILVLSFNESPYKELMEMQQKTWDSIEVEGVRTVYYYGGGKGWVNEKEFSANSQDFYYLMHDKLLDCLKEVIDWEWDLVVRTNSSSYLNKSRLIEFCSTLPKEKCYAGWKLNGDGWSSVSGACIIMSKDIVNLFMQGCDRNFEREEDIYIGQILSGHGIEIIDDKSRYDFYNKHISDAMSKMLATKYHLRFKTEDRIQDGNNMRLVHEKINSV